jgi:hypothetical protein
MPTKLAEEGDLVWKYRKNAFHCKCNNQKENLEGLFKNVQMQGAQKTEPRSVYRHTLSGAVCSATRQISVFQQPYSFFFFYNLLH